MPELIRSLAAAAPLPAKPRHLRRLVAALPPPLRQHQVCLTMRLAAVLSSLFDVTIKVTVTYKIGLSSLPRFYGHE